MICIQYLFFLSRNSNTCIYLFIPVNSLLWVSYYLHINQFKLIKIRLYIQLTMTYPVVKKNITPHTHTISVKHALCPSTVHYRLTFPIHRDTVPRVLFSLRFSMISRQFSHLMAVIVDIRWPYCNLILVISHFNKIVDVFTFGDFHLCVIVLMWFSQMCSKLFCNCGV